MSELMPNLDGITSYFDISSVDLANNKWLNRISVGNDILLPNGGNIQNNALYLSSSQYGKLQITEHRTIYCVFKTLEEKNTWSPIISKGLTSGSTSYTGFWLSLDPSGNVIAFYTTNGAVTSAIRGMEYHVACITRDDNNVGYFYLDGVLIGTTTSKSGNYQGYYYLNRLYRSGGFSDTPVNTEFQVCAFGTAYHDANIVKTNTVFLSTGYAPKDLRLAGTDAVAIAYAIARNQESAAALQEISKSFKDGVREGNDTVVDKTEPIPNDDDEIIIAGDDGDDTFPAEFERGGVYIKTKEITVTDDNGNEVTGVFQLHIGLGDMTYTIYSSTSCDWGIPPKVTLTGNGINKTLIFDGAYDAWKGSTAASAPGVKDGNEFWMTEAKISKSYPGITGKLYWEYSGGYRNRSWKFTGDFATALQAGAYVGTMPFDDVI